MSLTADQLKTIACDEIDKATAELNTISQEIWSHPEENYQEHYAHKIITDYLEKNQFPVQRGYITPTGFKAVYGSGSKPNISVLCEYDCIPEIGHACGHNLIAEVGVGAAIGIKAALDAAKDAGKELGLLTILGTPAEEGGGGKVDFIEAGEFSSVDLAMMAHPSTVNQANFSTTAVDMVKICYHGKASHATEFPWEGVNALDAAVMAHTSVSVLRKQMKPSWKIHGIISKGGDKPTIIPEETTMEFYARAPSMKELLILKQKADACFMAAATATGCTVDVNWNPKPYDNVISNPTLEGLYKNNAAVLGLEFEQAEITSESTDMGNVSHVVPGIHPIFYIGDESINHTSFTDAAGSPKAQFYALIQAKALAMTAIDVYCQPHLVEKMRTELNEALVRDANAEISMNVTD